MQARLGLAGQPYIAFLGMLEPRKNVPGLVRGWVKACSDRDDSSPHPDSKPAAAAARLPRSRSRLRTSGRLVIVLSLRTYL